MCQTIKWVFGMCCFIECSAQTDEVSTLILSMDGKTEIHRVKNLPEVTWVVKELR